MNNVKQRRLIITEPVIFHRIIFHTIFDANKGLELLREKDPTNPQWDLRDHYFGRVTYYITREQIKLLDDNDVRFWVTNI